MNMTHANPLDVPPPNLPIDFSATDQSEFRGEDAYAAKLIGVGLTVMFFYSLVVMLYVFYLTAYPAS
jgi:hypothetical protein